MADINVDEGAHRHGPRVVGDATYKVIQQQIEGGGGHFGSRVTVDSSAADIPDITAGTVGEAKALLDDIDDVTVLDRMHADERANPDYTGGRKGVLNAIEERKDELTTENTEE